MSTQALPQLLCITIVWPTFPYQHYSYPTTGRLRLEMVELAMCFWQRIEQKRLTTQLTSSVRMAGPEPDPDSWEMVVRRAHVMPTFHRAPEAISHGAALHTPVPRLDQSHLSTTMDTSGTLSLNSSSAASTTTGSHSSVSQSVLTQPDNPLGDNRFAALYVEDDDVSMETSSMTSIPSAVSNLEAPNQSMDTDFTLDSLGGELPMLGNPGIRDDETVNSFDDQPPTLVARAPSDSSDDSTVLSLHGLDLDDDDSVQQSLDGSDLDDFELDGWHGHDEHPHPHSHR